MKYTIQLGENAADLYYSGPRDCERYEIIGVVTRHYDFYSPSKGALAKDKLKGGYVMLKGCAAFRLQKRRVEALMRAPKKRGPKKKLEGGKKRQVWISDANYAWLKQIGNGNVRLGLSRYLDAKDKFENKTQKLARLIEITKQ